MAKSNEFSCTSMGEVCVTASKAGWEPKDFSFLSTDVNLMRKFLGVLKGTHLIMINEHKIDCNAPPLPVPGFLDAWEVKEHKKGGIIKLNSQKIKFYSRRGLENMFREDLPMISEVMEEVKGKKVLNATFLDYWFKYPFLIPEECKKVSTYFVGTTFYEKDKKNSENRTYVRDLFWAGKNWCINYCWTEHKFGPNDRIAYLAAA